MMPVRQSFRNLLEWQREVREGLVGWFDNVIPPFIWWGWWESNPHAAGTLAFQTSASTVPPHPRISVTKNGEAFLSGGLAVRAKGLLTSRPCIAMIHGLAAHAGLPFGGNPGVNWQAETERLLL